MGYEPFVGGPEPVHLLLRPNGQIGSPLQSHNTAEAIPGHFTGAEVEGIRVYLDHFSLRQIKRLHLVRVQPAVLIQILPLCQQQDQFPDGDVELVAGMPLKGVELVGMPPAQADLLVQSAAVDLPQLRGRRDLIQMAHIRFEHVSFAYQDKKVLQDVSIAFPRNTLTALVGPSGSGKSTVMKLCARFYDPQQGRVLFDGVPMKDIEPESLMSRISMVFQDVYLFQDTIRDNIRFGKPGATDEEIIAAAEKACCHDFIMRLPQGYDTMVGEGGCTLSGGEKQRISIARAILKDAPIILLDEATASLDPENEVEVQKAIDTLIKGRTVIVIAHKLKTIMNADRIVVLEDGRVKEQGTHDELMRHEGLYARLWTIQEKSAGWTV
jgi:ABC-type multidrug transport system fused ATPase/permease subunit